MSAHTADAFGNFGQGPADPDGNVQSLGSDASLMLHPPHQSVVATPVASAVKCILSQLIALAGIAVCCVPQADRSSIGAGSANSQAGQAGSANTSTLASGGVAGDRAANDAGLASGGVAGRVALGGAGSSGATDALRILVFTRTAGYRHTSIEAGISALQNLAEQRNWQLVATEDPTLFTDTGLETFELVLFLSTTGEILDPPQQAAMERFIRAGHGFVGVHAASDTEYEWPWYGALVGAYFKGHPAIQDASLVVEPVSHPATSHLASPWRRTDEWYAFQSNPRDRVHVLLRLDETSYDAGDLAMGEDHPIAWYHEYDGGRAFYTALGHTEASYQEGDFLTHLTGGIEWAGGRR